MSLTDIEATVAIAAAMADSRVDVGLDAASRAAEGKRAARQQQWLRARSK